MRRLLLVPAVVLALAATAALAANPARPPAGDQEHRPVALGRVTVGGGVSVLLPVGWHLTHGDQVQIYLGLAAPASTRAQIAAILSSWRVT